jgi:7,8-dihydropterin-6-yl-methyl-4-(beta-D-ribofuranosyl)aminobenzene 5'-phosphate synthase
MHAENINIRILVDNEAKNGLKAEHGFALWLEIDGQNILFDTGQNDALIKNTEQLGISLETAHTLVLSHGHYDHTGGLADVLSCNRQVKVYCHAAAFLPRYSVTDGVARPVKMTTRAMSSIANLPEEKLEWVTKAQKLTKSVGITGEIPRLIPFETTGGSFYFDQDGKRTDAIVDDMALWVEGRDGLIICIGCCHAGIINTINHIKKVSGIDKIHTIIGGLHLKNANDTRLEKTVDKLSREKIETLITCHCTGDKAHKLLAEKLGATMGFAGMELQIG